MNKYVKYDDFWWEYDVKTPKEKATLINLAGGRNSGVDITKCKIVKANDFEELDWNNTKVLDSKYKYGWLDRQGNFYGCEYYCHSLQAELVHHSSRRNLEKNGWIHISSNLHSTKLVATFCGDYEDGIMPTDAQVLFLSKHMGIDSTWVMFAYEHGNRAKAKIYERQLLKNKEKKELKQDDEEDILKKYLNF